LIANISGTDQAIDKRKRRYQLRFFSTFDENNFVNFDPLTKNDLDL